MSDLKLALRNLEKPKSKLRPRRLKNYIEHFYKDCQHPRTVLLNPDTCLQIQLAITGKLALPARHLIDGATHCLGCKHWEQDKDPPPPPEPKPELILRSPTVKPNLNLRRSNNGLKLRKSKPDLKLRENLMKTLQKLSNP